MTKHRRSLSKLERQRALFAKAAAKEKETAAAQQKHVLTESIIEALSSPTRSWRMRVIEIPLDHDEELWVRAEHVSALKTNFAHNRITEVILSSGEHYKASTSAYELCKLIDPSYLRERWTRREVRIPAEASFIVTEARPPVAVSPSLPPKKKTKSKVK